LVPSNNTIASEGALLKPVAGAPGVTFAGTGSYISVASGLVGLELYRCLQDKAELLAHRPIKKLKNRK
jgi:hypothetical protein